MVPRTANTRNSAPLTPIAALFAALEAATRATDTANERDDQHAASLFNQRTALVQRLTGAAEGGAS